MNKLNIFTISALLMSLSHITYANEILEIQVEKSLNVPRKKTELFFSLLKRKKM